MLIVGEVRLLASLQGTLKALTDAWGTVSGRTVAECTLAYMP